MPGGLLHAAHNGTLIVRHPSVMPTDVQLALAQALDQRIVPGTGGNRSINVRTIFISGSSLDQQLERGTLHKDLTSLFSAAEFASPALREIPEDIPTLAEHYLNYFSRHHHRSNLTFSVDAQAALIAYRWPGNTDELKTLVERAVLLASEQQITPSDLGLSTVTNESYQHDFSLDDYFRFFVLRHQSTLSETELASRLGISRKALWERRQKMRLPRDQS